MRYNGKIKVRRTLVQVNFRTTERAPLNLDVCWFHVLSVAVYTKLVMQISRALDEAVRMCPPDWEKQFNSAPVGKRRKMVKPIGWSGDRVIG